MASEISVVLQYSISKGFYKFEYSPGRVQIDQTGVGGGNPGVVSVGTAEENISFGDITTPGVLLMRNLDGTNFVTWGVDSASSLKACGILRPGGPAVFIPEWKSGAVLRMQSDTAACLVWVHVDEK